MGQPVPLISTAMLLAACAVGCGEVEPAEVDAATAPAVVSTRPTDLATAVEPEATIDATFSEDMRIDGDVFRVQRGDVAIAGEVAYDAASRTGTFTPHEPLGLLGPYTATITRGATAMTGQPLAADVTWRFTVRDGRWGTPEPLESGNGIASLPSIAFDATGNAIAVWQQQEAGRYDLWANRYVAGTGWGTPARIETDNAGSAIDARVAIDGRGDAIAVWLQSDGTRTGVRASRYQAGSGWGPTTALETGSRSALSPRMAIDGDGHAIAVWQQADDQGNWNVWANRYVPGVGWGSASLLDTRAENIRIAMDGAGNAVAVWRQHDGTRFNVRANRYVVGSGWGTATLIESDPGAVESQLDVGVDEAGNAIAVWRQHDGTRHNLWANRFAVAGGWGNAQLIEQDHAGSAYAPRVAVSRAGSAVVVWMQSDGARENAWATRFDPATGWATPGLLERDDAGAVTSIGAAIDGNGHAIAVWSQSNGTRRNAWTSRLVAGAGWSAPALLESADTGDATIHEVAVDQTGHAAAAWWQADGTRTDVWVSLFR